MTAPDEPITPPVTPAKPRRPWKLVLMLLVLIPVAGFALYTWTALHWDYSNGYRSGTLQKFSRKGWTCKTYEGELWQSIMANNGPIDSKIWNFSVRDERVVRALDTLVGKDVRVHYTEHRGVPFSCFGDTPFFVDSVTVMSK
jgi:hypothetical protein